MSSDVIFAINVFMDSCALNSDWIRCVQIHSNDLCVRVTTHPLNYAKTVCQKHKNTADEESFMYGSPFAPQTKKYVIIVTLSHTHDLLCHHLDFS